MIDLQAQTQLFESTAALVRSILLASMRTLALSAGQGLALWSELARGASVPLGASDGAAPREVRPRLSGPAQETASSPGRWPARQPPPSSGWAWMPAAAADRADLPWTPMVRSWWLGPTFSMWLPAAEWAGWTAASVQAWSSWLDQAPLASDAGYSAYRSSGGHALAQVASPGADLAELTASAVLSPMHALLGFWRAVLER